MFVKISGPAGEGSHAGLSVPGTAGAREARPRVGAETGSRD